MTQQRKIQEDCRRTDWAISQARGPHSGLTPIDKETADKSLHPQGLHSQLQNQRDHQDPSYLAAGFAVPGKTVFLRASGCAEFPCVLPTLPKANWWKYNCAFKPPSRGHEAVRVGPSGKAWAGRNQDQKSRQTKGTGNSHGKRGERASLLWQIREWKTVKSLTLRPIFTGFF